MTDSRITRIVDQLADLSDEEMTSLVETINTKRTERKREKQNDAIQKFEALFQKLSELHVDVIYSDDAGRENYLNLEDISFQPW